MKNRLEILFINSLKASIVILFSLIAAGVTIIVLDFLGYESQVRKIVGYLHL
jgi:hypothetical protein